MPQEVRNKISSTKGGIKTEKRICIGCGIEFEVPKWSKKVYHNRQCAMKVIGSRSHHNIWNKGLGLDDPRIKASSEKQSQTLKQRYASGELRIWNDGLTAETDERIRKLTDHLTQLRTTPGEWKDRWIESMRKGQVKAWAEGKYNRPITAPEQLTWNYLESLGYPVKWFKDIQPDDPPGTWYFQFPFFESFVPDFACPDREWIIEVNGCAVHGHDLDKCTLPGAKYGWNKFAEDNAKRDRKKYWLYNDKGWRWALVWQCEAEDGDFHRVLKYLSNGD